MSNIKIKDFLCEKLNNFKVFINSELSKISGDTPITNDHIEALNKELNFFISNIDIFISTISVINSNNTDETIKIFLNKYNIDIDDIKKHIDYKKLCRYIEMFKDVLKNNIN